jgi:hypothetical protein
VNEWTAESLGVPLSPVEQTNFASVSEVSGAMDGAKRASRFLLLPSYDFTDPVGNETVNCARCRPCGDLVVVAVHLSTVLFVHLSISFYPCRAYRFRIDAYMYLGLDIQSPA